MPVTWKLAEYLERHDLTPYRLMEHSGLSSNTVYPIARNDAERVSKKVLEKLVLSLRELTGEDVNVGDILTLEADDA